MIIIYVFSAVLLLISILKWEDDYAIADHNGTIMSVQELADNLRDKDVVFFGEYHGEKVCHELEINLLKELYFRNPRIVLSLEMFERDVQKCLDNYLEGLIPEEEFLACSRPWPNYETDYRPLIEFAKESKLRVIAANVPRKYASMIAKSGIKALFDNNDVVREHFAENLLTPDDEYKRTFITTISQNKFGGSELGAPTELLENMYAAQCLKDDTMAESIAREWTQASDILILHINGDFHSRRGLGTVKKVKLLEPGLDVAVITPVYANGSISALSDEHILHEADFTILINPGDK